MALKRRIRSLYFGLKFGVFKSDVVFDYGSVFSS